MIDFKSERTDCPINGDHIPTITDNGFLVCSVCGEELDQPIVAVLPRVYNYEQIKRSTYEVTHELGSEIYIYQHDQINARLFAAIFRYHGARPWKSGGMRRHMIIGIMVSKLTQSMNIGIPIKERAVEILERYKGYFIGFGIQIFALAAIQCAIYEHNGSDNMESKIDEFISNRYSNKQNHFRYFRVLKKLKESCGLRVPSNQVWHNRIIQNITALKLMPEIGRKIIAQFDLARRNPVLSGVSPYGLIAALIYYQEKQYEITCHSQSEICKICGKITNVTLRNTYQRLITQGLVNIQLVVKNLGGVRGSYLMPIGTVKQSNHSEFFNRFCCKCPELYDYGQNTHTHRWRCKMTGDLIMIINHRNPLFHGVENCIRKHIKDSPEERARILKKWNDEQIANYERPIRIPD
jgi:transcription initiation factor TFIIIB Brf1 subunit/transcription initiation factor TFIIB